jgi:hypothetical protein
MPNTKPPLEERHDKWLATIRDVASTVITLEEERVPSFTALKLQWKRICWVSMLWMHSTSRNVYENLPCRFNGKIAQERRKSWKL